MLVCVENERKEIFIFSDLYEWLGKEHTRKSERLRMCLLRGNSVDECVSFVDYHEMLIGQSMNADRAWASEIDTIGKGVR